MFPWESKTPTSEALDCPRSQEIPNPEKAMELFVSLLCGRLANCGCG